MLAPFYRWGNKGCKRVPVQAALSLHWILPLHKVWQTQFQFLYISVSQPLRARKKLCTAKYKESREVLEALSHHNCRLLNGDEYHMHKISYCFYVITKVPIHNPVTLGHFPCTPEFCISLEDWTIRDDVKPGRTVCCRACRKNTLKKEIAIT